ncbi:MAG: hypothetical protein RBU30_23050 [Polyangia bacterium]|jgi:class 3 adenylate cyclase|nr:hypothetical protein [Polyangia bacterium]
MHILLATEVLPPPEAGSQAAVSLAREHQERAGALAASNRGAVLVRVGRGCVSRFGDLDDALAALSELMSPSEPRRSRPTRLRASIHIGALGGEQVPLASPAVIAARALLGQAGPGEILFSDGLAQALRDRGLQSSPILAGAGAAASPAACPPAHRLLTRPRRPRGAAMRPVSGWLLGAAVVVAVIAAVGTLAVTLL